MPDFGKYVSRLPASTPPELARALADVFRDLNGEQAPIEKKLDLFPMLDDYGGKGDGVNSNTDAETAAEADVEAVYIPQGAYKDTRTHLAPTKRYFGDGYTVDANGRKRARYFSSVRSRPSSGDLSGFDTIFNGDWSNCPFPIHHYVTGATTAWSTGGVYNQLPEICPFFLYMRNESGAGGSAPANTGVGVTAGWFKVASASSDPSATIALTLQATCNTAVSGSPPAISGGQNAVVLLTGQVDTNVAGIFLNTVEIDSNDNGYDVACIGYNNRLTRTNGTGANSAFWAGFRASSEGSQPIDGMFVGIGKAKYGLDFTQADFSSNFGAAIVLKENQRIFFNATPGTLPAGAASANQGSLRYNPSTGRLTWEMAGTDAVLQLDTNALWIGSGMAAKIGGLDVLKSRVTGWTNPSGWTNTANNRGTAYDCNTITLAQLAQLFHNLLTDLHAQAGHGMIGA